MEKAKKFRSLLNSPQLEFLCEAHNGISAVIAEEAGFKGIWGSGLSLSAQFGVRDNNEASWTQVLEMLEFMSDATRVPILLDGDTGYGNFNNMRRLVKKLEQREIAAVCIEDKLFPKTNSFIQGQAQPLADIDEFCGKIKAGKDAQRHDDFSIVARVEAFIAGWGLSEALQRAEAYRKAGADAVLIHSALSMPDEVLAFKKEWANRLPVVIVPTKYYSTPTEVFRDHGFSLVIWANHLLRASIAAMQQTARSLASDQNLFSVEDRVVPVAEVFRLQGAVELQQAEKKYLPLRHLGIQALVLAASRGEELGELTENRPKTMVSVAGRPLLAHIVEALNATGIKNISVVRGYKKEAVNLPNLNLIDNDDYAASGELVSLLKGLQGIQPEQDLIVCYGDVLFNKYIVQILAESRDPLAVAIDTNWMESVNRDRQADYASCSLPHSRESFSTRIWLQRIGTEISRSDIHGEWMGFFKIAAAEIAAVAGVVERMLSEGDQRWAKLPDLLNLLVEKGNRVGVYYTTGHWLDVDSLEDVVHAGNF